MRPSVGKYSENITIAKRKTCEERKCHTNRSGVEESSRGTKDAIEHLPMQLLGSVETSGDQGQLTRQDEDRLGDTDQT